MITILLPVLDRPDKAKRVADSIRSSETKENEIVFLCSPGDTAEIRACEKTGEQVIVVDWQPGPADFAKKINRGFMETSRTFVLIGADDLRFHTEWDTELLQVAEETKAAVIGSTDMGNPEVNRKRLYSTHPLVRRSYIRQQGGTGEGRPGELLYEGYDHNYVDRELWDVAKSRQLTAFAPKAKIEHLHPLWGKGRMDATYKKGLAKARQDQRLYWSRHILWGAELGPRETAELARWQRRMTRLGQ